MFITHPSTNLIFCHNKWKHQNDQRKKRKPCTESKTVTLKHKMSIKKYLSRGYRLVKLSTETAVLTAAMQEQVISASNCKQHILSDQNVTAKCAQNADSTVKPYNINRCMSCASPRRLQPTSLSSGRHCSSRIVCQMSTVNALFWILAAVRAREAQQ